ncbi:MAG: protein kinase domain-containing protein [Rubrobacteraceae bacterium]
MFRENTAGGIKVLDVSVKTVLGGRYRVQGTLGKGGMAVVYRAEDAILGRVVALKTLRSQFAEDPIFQQRFKQEARAMAYLDHENIVRVYDISQDEQTPFIVAECVSGDDLGRLLNKERRLEESFTREVAAQLLRALSYAHRRGVIHRDIKPSNILIDVTGAVKVADFGIARLLENDEAGEPGEIIGSARYMSPEQLTGKQTTQRSDIYSVGILLYNCLTGEPPFVGDLKSLTRRQLREDPRPPRELNQKISPHMEAVILKALAKDPAERYQSAGDMLEDLQVRSTRRRDPASAGSFLAGRWRLVAATLALLMLLAGGAMLAAGLGYPLGSAGASPTDPASQKPLRGVDAVLEEPPPAAPQDPQTAQKLFAKLSGSGTASSAAPPVTPPTSDKTGYVVVPNVRTYFDYSAREILANSGFRVRIVHSSRSGYANRGVTWKTRPAIGTPAPPGSTVTVYATPKLLYQPKL